MKPPVADGGGAMPADCNSLRAQRPRHCSDGATPPLLPVPAEAQAVGKRISALVRFMTAAEFPSCCDPAFLGMYRRLLSLVDTYQHEVLRRYHRAKTCHAGCSYCCYHWVVDVNSFEAAIIAQHLRDYFPDAIPAIIQRLRADYEQYLRLEAMVAQKKLAQHDLFAAERIDEEDLLLSCFYQLKRPCPLLDAAGLCMIYELRPLTCRMYMSFAAPGACKPQHINQRPIGTYLLDIEGDAGELLDELHFRFMTFDGDVGLRSLLLKHLLESHPSQRALLMSRSADPHFRVPG